MATDANDSPSVSSDDVDVALRDLAYRIAGPQRNRVDSVGNGLIRSSRYLRQIIEGETAWPTQKQWKDRLAALRCAADLIARELGDGRMMNALDTFNRQSRNPSHISLDNLREDVETLAVLARQARDEVPSGSGQSTLELYPAGLSALEICAAFIVGAWQHLHDRKVPPHTSRLVHSACESLWNASHGYKRGWSDKKSGWRQPLEVAKSARGAAALRYFDNCMLAGNLPAN